MQPWPAPGPITRISPDQSSGPGPASVRKLYWHWPSQIIRRLVGNFTPTTLPHCHTALTTSWILYFSSNKLKILRSFHNSQDNHQSFQVDTEKDIWIILVIHDPWCSSIVSRGDVTQYLWSTMTCRTGQRSHSRWFESFSHFSCYAAMRRVWLCSE